MRENDKVMKSLDIKKIPKMTIILYSCAVIMTICTMIIIYKSNLYIESLVVQGFEPSKEILEVVNYYIVTVTPFVFYIAVLFALGYIIKKIHCIIRNQETRIENNNYLYEESSDKYDDIEDLLSNI